MVEPQSRRRAFGGRQATPISGLAMHLVATHPRARVGQHCQAVVEVGGRRRLAARASNTTERLARPSSRVSRSQASQARCANHLQLLVVAARG
jgi:hypothetical protein